MVKIMARKKTNILEKAINGTGKYLKKTGKAFWNFNHTKKKNTRKKYPKYMDF